ncbi:MAG: hypothetical protein M3490_12930 [Chloroflexota bacterium]|nr:hypothetical protein [Chloroflexota bacterium]
MSDSPTLRVERARVSRRLALLSAVVLVLLGTWVIWKFGGFDLMATVELDGRRQTVVNTFATVDHPFHTVRGETLLESLRDGEPLRWIAHHQGGYPVEFYPLGIPWLDVGLWALLLGQFPIIAVHKLAVLIVFILPAVGFWWLAQGDRLNPFVPVLALAIQVTTTGLWWTGGMIELIEWGLVANVGGATLAFLAMAALVRFILQGQTGFGVAAILASSAALYTNTRSGIAVSIAAVAVIVGVLLDRHPERQVPIGLALRRVALVAGASGLMAAPLLFALFRYADLYYFVNFKEYTGIGEFWHDTLAAVSRPLFGVATAGIVLALVMRRLSVLRVVAISGLLYAGLTVALSSGGLGEGAIQQLETTRLMPFQRLLVVYLAAAAVGWLLDAGVARLPVPDRSRLPMVSSLLVIGAVVMFSSYDGEYGDTPETHYTTPTPHALTTGRVEFAEFSGILAEANEIVPEGRAIYVVEDRESWWHEQLWGPSQADEPFFYDDWMWYWHPDFDAPYDYREGHFIPNPVATFNEEWLSGNGIGALIVTDREESGPFPDPREAARQNPLFDYQVTVGNWDLYLVRNSTSVVTNGTVMPVALDIENQSIMATFESAEGIVDIRRNWFPRWEAFADGEEVDVTRTSNGYMQITVPEGTQSVELQYAATWSDWLGRLAAVLGLVVVVALGVGPRSRGSFRNRNAQDV